MKSKVWAHRGASAYAPENSLEAFSMAIDMKADGIELDIYETADGKLVIHHDNDIKRMTNGVDAKILETDFDVLRSYNFNGKWGDQFGFVKIPEFSEVLDLFKKTDMMINVELKQGSVNYLKAINAMVQEFGMQEQIIYSSFDHVKLAQMKKINPAADIATLYTDPMYEPWCYGKMLGLKAFHPHYQQLYRYEEYGMDFVAGAHESGIEVNVWTANKPGIMRHVAKAGVDHIITDYPDVALQIVNELENE
ncbi:MAG: glycerophosphodiester phosphodiesterase [Clostridia bacterium]|nr:glycerophosphodiester phosphodiesterase [Clostridia bacterium]